MRCDGRRFRTFNVIDDRNREALAIVIDFKLACRAGRARESIMVLNLSLWLWPNGPSNMA